MVGNANVKIDIEKAVSLYTQGLSLKEIAEYFSCGSNTVKRHLIKNGIEIRSKHHYAQQKNAWWQQESFLRVKYVDEGLSTTQISKLVGANARTVLTWLQEFNITTRPTGGAYKKGKKMPPEFGQKISEAKKGKNTGVENPNWKGSKITNEVRERRSYETKIWRERCKERDGYRCTICGSADLLHVHHILEFKNYPERRLDLNNGKTVCVFCHETIHQRTFPDWVTGRETTKKLPISKLEKNEWKRFEIDPAILRWIRENNSIALIAEMFEVDRQTIVRFAHKNNIPTTRPKFNYLPDRNLLLKVYSKNNLEQTAKHFNVGQTVVHKWLKHYEIPRRNHGVRP